MADDPIRPQPGNCRDPKSFVGRREITEEALRRLLQGSNLWLSDPRRMGKTYWLTYFAQTQTAFRAVLIDYEGVSTTHEFLTRTVEGLRAGRLGERFRRFISTVFDHVDEAAVGPVSVKALHQATPAPRLLQTTLEGLNDPGEQPVLIIMDEVAMAVENIVAAEGAASARDLLQILRRVRGATPQVRWIVAGSIGFHHVLRLAGATEGDLNDLETLRFGPLEPDEAPELAQRLFLGIGAQADETAVTALVETTDAIPYLMHAIASSLQQKGVTVVSAADVHETFEDFIDDHDQSKSYAHLLTRLDHFYGEDTALAQGILDGVLDPSWEWVEFDSLPESLTQNPAFDSVVDKLVGDHYLELRGRRTRWRYPRLQYIWARRRRVWDRP